MSRGYRLLLFGVIMVLMVSNQSLARGPDTLWMRTYGGPGKDVVHEVRPTTDGGYILGGYTNSYGHGSRDVYLIKTDNAGDTLWSRAFGGTSLDYGRCIEITSEGGYIIAGTTHSFGSGAGDFYLIKTDSSGSVLWSRTYGGSLDDLGWSVQQTWDGGYVVLGHTRSFGLGDWDIYVVRTNASGDTLWTRTWGGVNDDRAYSLLLASDGNYLFSGYTKSFGPGPRNLFLVKMNTSGDILWAKTFKGSENDDNCSVQETYDGGYVVVGGDTQSFGTDNEEILLVRTNADGDSLWTRTYGGQGNECGWSVRQVPDGGFIICGYTDSFGEGNQDIYLIRTDAHGDTVWTRTSGGPYADYGRSILSTGDGAFIIAGETWSFGAGSADGYLIRTEGENPIVSRIVDVPNDQGKQVSITWHRSMYDAPHDSVVITGYSVWRRKDILSALHSADCAETATNRNLLAYPPGDWGYVLTVPARGERVYSSIVPSLCDSTSEGICWSVFFVSAMTPDPLSYFDSDPDSGYSVDNLAPAPPSDLRMTSPSDLAWAESQEADFNYFTVYGSAAPGLDTTAVLIGYTIETGVDVSGDEYNYYHVTATDFVGNEGDASSVENAYAGVSGGEDLPIVFALRQNRPNPFESSTVISFDLPEPCEVRLEIVDVQGRVVRVLADEAWLAGRHSVAWTGENDAGEVTGPGVYFVRIQAGGFTATNKMLLMK